MNPSVYRGKFCSWCDKFTWFYEDKPICKHCKKNPYLSPGHGSASGMLSKAEVRDLERHLGPNVRNFTTSQQVKEYLKANKIADAGRT